MIDPDRAFCGLATIIGEPPMDWTADAFRPWVQLELALPVMVNHDMWITPHGVTTEIGRVTQTALIEETSTHPAGLLVLGHLYPGPGDEVLAGVRDSRPGLPQWGLSIAAAVYADEGVIELVLPHEVSVTLSPVYDQALILGVGERARAVWDLLVPRQPKTRTPW